MLSKEEYKNKITIICKYCKKDIRNCCYGNKFIVYTANGIALCKGLVKQRRQFIY